MKKTLTTVAALVACAATQLFAQNAKKDVITFSLSTFAQASVSTSATAKNAGLWSSGPQYYKTATGKVNNNSILQAIAIVLHGSSGYYSKYSNPQIVLVQGELGGFFGYPYISSYTYDSTITGDNIRLATGRNMTNNPIDGALPPGHNQPWGQFYVQGNDRSGNATLCENVSFFFAIQVQECYDCFYLNSFISDASFKFTGLKGPPCCAGSEITTGSGKDKYYLTLDFDNTINNPYLNPTDFVSVQSHLGSFYAGSVAGSTNTIPIVDYDDFYGIVGDSTYGLYPGIVGLVERDNGVNPDGLPYVDSITSTVSTPLDHHSYDLYTLRFALNGIMTYSWSLKFINKGDSFPDFVGLGTYGGVASPVQGYGYAAKVCTLFQGTVLFNEGIFAVAKCCLDEPWFDTSGTNYGYWYGIGDNDIGADLSKGVTGDIENYFDTAIAGDRATGHLGDCVPVNTDLDLSLHVNYNYGYNPLQQAIEGAYPQPGLEGSWTSDPSFPPIFDIQPPQGDDRPADGSVD